MCHNLWAKTHLETLWSRCVKKQEYKEERWTIAQEKTAITTLVHAGVPPTPVQQHSGHKSLASMNNYSTASLNQQKDMSDQVVIFSKASETVGTPQEFSENFDGLDTVFQDIGNFEFNINIVNNMFTTASVPFSQLKELFTSATINGNVKINFGNSEINLYSNRLTLFSHCWLFKIK